ncbi:hypothetical protein [Rhizobium indicum]|uniref:Uncharacterized protein n=1 Tax=Rhizobium indicum TaxID=2583231 RepID=A0ABX6PLR9_9HYPH|nr:hypothetical protein [Rhizobium indicum]QKK19615.1 hypothetical protein FFM53_029195 [Rhizobium indicum]
MSELHHEFKLRSDFLPTTREDECIAPRSATTPVRGAPKLQRALSPRPLVVDLDGTLIRSDLLIETAFSEVRRRR